MLQFHQVSSKLDEKQKSFINNPFLCLEFQSVSRIVKIVHSGRYIFLEMPCIELHTCAQWIQKGYNVKCKYVSKLCKSYSENF